jgi:hypothetical protein
VLLLDRVRVGLGEDRPDTIVATKPCALFGTFVTDADTNGLEITA